MNALRTPTVAWHSRTLLPGTLIAIVLSGGFCRAADVIKHSSGTNLSAAASWTGGTGPAPSSTDVARWNTGSLGGTLTLGSTASTTLSWQGINIQGATAALVIDGGAASQLLDIGSSGVNIASQNLTVGGTSTPTWRLSTDQTWTIGSGRQLSFNGANVTIGSGVNTGGLLLVLNASGSGNSAAVVFNGNGRTYDLTKAVISGPGCLQVRNNDTVTLGPSNTFDGVIDIRTNGRINYQTLADNGTASSFGDGGSTLSNLTTITNNSTVLTNVGAGGSTNRAITYGSGGTPGITLVNNGTGTVQFLGTTAIAPNAVFTLDGSFTGGSNTFAQPIGGATTSLVKSGNSTWVLAGVNTYEGNTTINAGTLKLQDNAQLKFIISATNGVSNHITGAGSLEVDGDFNIDTTLADASALTSGSWVLESVPSTYGATFSVIGFNDAGGNTWTKTVGEKTYLFNETTGTLTLSTGYTYTSWISGFDYSAYPGADLSATADADQDGVTNLVEHVFGTAPNAPTPGLEITATTPTSVSFKHPLSANIASDITYGYEWSTDLSEWILGSGTNTQGTEVFVTPLSPGVGEAGAEMQIVGGPTAKLFVRVLARQGTP
ncbi:MAG: autotransporter-associated beta strand repeat-containing protein [Luteolibacter sp.]